MEKTLLLGPGHVCVAFSTVEQVEATVSVPCKLGFADCWALGVAAPISNMRLHATNP